MSKEIWKQIEGLDITAEISNMGRVRVRDVNAVGYYVERGIKNMFRGADKRWRVYLPVDGVGTAFLVHRLVAELHVDNPNGYNHLKFKNGDSTGYYASNLEWSKSPDLPDRHHKIGVDDVATIRIRSEYGESMTKLAEEFGISVSYVSRLVNGERS